MLSGNHQVRRFQHRLNAHREQALEVHRAERVVGADRVSFCRNHRPFIQIVGRPEDAEAGLRVAADDRQLIDDGPRYFGSSDGWYWIVPCLEC